MPAKAAATLAVDGVMRLRSATAVPSGMGNAVVSLMVLNTIVVRVLRT